MKYSYEEKLAAVLSVVRGQHSVSSVSKHFGISYTPLSRWIARYKEFGEAGLRIRQYTYSGDFKLSAIRHMHENHWICCSSPSSGDGGMTVTKTLRSSDCPSFTVTSRSSSSISS